jgi:hypothetical protein
MTYPDGNALSLWSQWNAQFIQCQPPCTHRGCHICLVSSCQDYPSYTEGNLIRSSAGDPQLHVVLGYHPAFAVDNVTDKRLKGHRPSVYYVILLGGLRGQSICSYPSTKLHRIISQIIVLNSMYICVCGRFCL